MPFGTCIKWKKFFFGLAISICLSTTQHPMNMPSEYYTSCSIFYDRTNDLQLCDFYGSCEVQSNRKSDILVILFNLSLNSNNPAL